MLVVGGGRDLQADATVLRRLACHGTSKSSSRDLDSLRIAGGQSPAAHEDKRQAAHPLASLLLATKGCSCRCGCTVALLVPKTPFAGGTLPGWGGGSPPQARGGPRRTRRVLALPAAWSPSFARSVLCQAWRQSTQRCRVRKIEGGSV